MPNEHFVILVIEPFVEVTLPHVIQVKAEGEAARERAIKHLTPDARKHLLQMPPWRR